MEKYLSLHHLKLAVQLLVNKIRGVENKVDNNTSKLTTLENTVESIGNADWNEDDSTDGAYILNRPAIRAGEGENSIIENQIDPDDDAAIYTIYVTGAASVKTYTYTTNDELPTAGSILTYGFAYYENGSLKLHKYHRITYIDLTTNIISFNATLSTSALSNTPVKILYKQGKAIGDNSHAEGVYTYSIGTDCHSEGGGSISIGNHSHAEGYMTLSTGSYAHAEGNSTKASGAASHAEGNHTNAEGIYSHSEGHGYLSLNDSKHKLSGEANSTTYTAGDYYTYYSVGQKISTSSNGYDNAATITGTNRTNKTITLDKTLDAENALSNQSIYILGYNNGSYGHTEGQGTTVLAPTGHAEGIGTVVRYAAGHAEGEGSFVFSEAGHAEGIRTQVQNTGAAGHAEGELSAAGGQAAHAEGYQTGAMGNYSHAEGYLTKAMRKSQHVFGEYNQTDESGSGITVKGAYVEIVGNGTAEDARSNARTLDWNGNETLAGKLTVGTAPTADMDVATKKYVDDNAGGTPITYAISMANNVITLTGSEGSPSSVTLPIYAGAVIDNGNEVAY